MPYQPYNPIKQQPLSLSLFLCIIYYSIGWLVCSVFGLVWLRGWTVYIFWTVGPLLTTGNLLKQERIIQYIQKSLTFWLAFWLMLNKPLIDNI